MSDFRCPLDCNVRAGCDEELCAAYSYYRKGIEDGINKFLGKVKHHIMNDWNMDLSSCDECVILLDQVENLANEVKGENNG